MGSKTYKKIAVPLVAVALSALPVAASAQMSVDYSKNGATGTYQPQVVHKDYSKNGATGDYPSAFTAPHSVAPQPAPAQPTDDGFAWGAAAIGAISTALLLLLATTTARRIRRRRISPPGPARPSAV
jgi:hypothetical protein